MFVNLLIETRRAVNDAAAETLGALIYRQDLAWRYTRDGFEEDAIDAAAVSGAAGWACRRSLFSYEVRQGLVADG